MPDYMRKGKHICRILKEIRRNIAVANDIEYITSECRYHGDCMGTCPKCEEELRYLESQLRAKSLQGHMINLAGISVGALAMLSVNDALAQTEYHGDEIAVVHSECQSGPVTVKGCVVDGDTAATDKLAPLIGVSVAIKGKNIGVSTDIDGKFEIQAMKGDTLRVAYVGFDSMELPVTGDMNNIKIELKPDSEMLMETVAIAGGTVPRLWENTYINNKTVGLRIKLTLYDEDMNLIDPGKVFVDVDIIDRCGKVYKKLNSVCEGSMVYIYCENYKSRIGGELRRSAEGYQTEKIILSCRDTYEEVEVVLEKKDKDIYF